MRTVRRLLYRDICASVVLVVLAFLALFYFTVGVFNAAGPMARPWLAWLEMACSVLLFLGAILFVRERRLASPPA